MRGTLRSLLGKWFGRTPAAASAQPARAEGKVALRPPLSIAEWLGEDETRLHRIWRYPADPAADDPGSSAVALGLCCTSPAWWAMTPVQRQVFLELGKLQLECGLHSLLPNVMEALLWLAQRPWWDARVADIEAEGVE